MNVLYTAMVIGNTLINIALVVCILLAAIHFNSWGILWFWLIPAFNSFSFKSRTEKDKE